MTPQDKKEEWRERFDRAVAENYRGQDPYWPDWEGVKNFIASELALAKKEGYEEGVREMFGDQFMLPPEKSSYMKWKP